MRRALELARQAILRDPGYGPAHAMEALVHAVLASYTPEPVLEHMERAREAAGRAIEIDETLADAHAAMGLVYLGYDWRWADAARAFRRATELDPRDGTARSWLGFWHLTRGNGEQALLDTRHAELLDPASLIIKTQVAWVLFFLRRHAEALDQLERTLQVDRRCWRAYLNAAFCHIAVGRNDDAVHALETAFALNELQFLRVVMARAHARAGRTREARTMLAEAVSSGQHVLSYFLAQARSAVGDVEEAGRLLVKSCVDREWILIFLRLDPAMDELRGHPAYREVVDRMAF